MLEETGIAVRLTRLVGVFGGPDFIVHYRNGHRTSYVMTVFEATAEDHAGQPDGAEVLEVKFMSPEDWASASVAKWVPTVLNAIFDTSKVVFQAATAEMGSARHD